MLCLIGKNPRNKLSSKWLDALTKYLKDRECEITVCTDWITTLGYAAVEKFAVIWMDWSLVDSYFNKFQRKLHNIGAQVPLIVLADAKTISGELSLHTGQLFAVVSLGQPPEHIADLFERLERYQEFNSYLSEEIRSHLRPSGFHQFVGNGKSMLSIYRQIAKVSQTDFTVLITGGSGSGKELVARSIHDLSVRREKPFLAVNCAAIPQDLLESELFGYEQGAFTGANQTKKGKFELANKGTLFLDEIGDMPLPLQAKLLRVLETQTIERLGGTAPTKIDIRILAATNQDLSALIKEKKFRADLHHRLNVIPIRLPNLQDRPEDIPLLTLHILGKLAQKNPQIVKSISWDLIENLRAMSLVGNVRELENILTRVVFHSESQELNWKDVQSSMEPMTQPADIDTVPADNDEIRPLKEVEKQTITQAMELLDGNISRVAARLEISRTALYRKLEKYGIAHRGRD
jgi:DNA-binding NtrC family response regulator